MTFSFEIVAMQLTPSFKMGVLSHIEACHDAFAFASARSIGVEFAGRL